MKAEQYIEDRAVGGRRYFKTNSAIDVACGGDDAVRVQVRRLKRQGRIASPMRSIDIVVPLE